MIFMMHIYRVQLSSDGQRPSIMAKENFVQVHVSFISKQVSQPSFHTLRQDYTANNLFFYFVLYVLRQKC